jgi:hypothetical protein
MSYAGSAVLVGAPEGTRFNFNRTLMEVNVQIRFFSDAAGLTTIAGPTGSATLTVTHSASMWRGTNAAPIRIDDGANVVSAFTSTVYTLVPDGKWQPVDLGGGASSIVVTPSVILSGGAVSYSIVVDADVRAV